MTTREELDARLAEFDRRRAAADAVLAGRTDSARAAMLSGSSAVPPMLPVPDLLIGQDGARTRSVGRLGRWLGRTA